MGGVGWGGGGGGGGGGRRWRESVCSLISQVTTEDFGFLSSNREHHRDDVACQSSREAVQRKEINR